MRSVTQVSSPMWKASSPGNDPHPLGQAVKSSLCQQCWRLIPSASPCFPQKPIPLLCWALVVTLGLNWIFLVFYLFKILEITWGLCHSLLFRGHDSVGLCCIPWNSSLALQSAWGYMSCWRVLPGRCWDVDDDDLKRKGSENCWKFLLCL